MFYVTNNQGEQVFWAFDRAHCEIYASLHKIAFVRIGYREV